jgi:hypothetical protein
VPNYAENAAEILLKPKGLKAPKPIIQENIYRILQNIRKNSEGYRLVEKLMKRPGKFAFYVSLSDTGEVEETIDLLKGMK